MTGETAKGRSMSERSRFRPGKLNLAITQEAARPKTKFAANVTAAVIRVMRKADIASGSEILAM